MSRGRVALLYLAPPLLLLASAAGCSSEPELSPADRERLAPHLGAVVPASSTPSRVRFGDSITLTGHELSSEEIGAGGAVELTLHFEVDGPLPKGTRAFTHLVDAEGNLLANADEHGLVRAIYPPDRWRRGDRIRDTTLIRVPRSHRGATSIRVGFFNGDRRIEATLEGGGRADHLALEGPRVHGRTATPSALPTLEVGRAGSIVIDGILDEPTWRDADQTQAFLHTLSGAETRVSARARMAWDDEHLYFAIEVLDGDLRTPFKERDDPLWEADVVELFLDPSGAGVDYLELQVSPRGVTFDTHYARRRVPPPIGNADWDSRMEAAVSLRGTLNDSKPDEGYTVEARVPFASLASRSPRASAPSPRAEWRANFYVIDVGRGHGSAAAWSPPLVPDFHFPPRFGRLVFVD